MYVIIFSIDKNYEVYQELKNGGGGFKKSPCAAAYGAGSRVPLRARSSLPSRIQGQIRRIETRMTPGEAGGKEGTMNFGSPPRRALLIMFLVSPPSGLRNIYYPNTPGFTRGHHGKASSRPLVTLLNLNLITQKATIPMNNVES
jgi:hypothetical protein